MSNDTDEKNTENKSTPDNVVDIKQAVSAENEQEIKIRELEEANKELNNKFLRALADADNMRRRTEKEKSDMLKYGNERILTDILPVLDSFEKALNSDFEECDASSVKEGMRLVSDQLKSALEKHGLKRIDSKNQPFDPNFHQAIQKMDDEDIDVETVAEEFAAGYTLNGRLVRPAMVSVRSPAK